MFNLQLADFAVSQVGNLYETNEETIYGSSSDGDGTTMEAAFCLILLCNTILIILCPPQLNTHGVWPANSGDVLTVYEDSRIQINKCRIG